MVSKLKTLLLAGLAVPLAAGLALAQSTPPTDAGSAPAAAATAGAPGKAAKQPGALRATPAEKKASYEKTSLKRGGKKTHVAPAHAAPAAGKSARSDGTTTQKPGSAAPETPAKSD